jgi:F-type H+-transporting ATPase subunit b
MKKLSAIFLSSILMSFALILAPINNAQAATSAPATHSTAEVGAEATQAVKESATEAHEANGEEEEGVVGMFGLNWKLFLAQLVNFGIVLFVLWKWVFKPVTKGLSDRTAKIENSLEDAERIAKDRETFESWKQGEMSIVRTEASAIITQAKQTAEALKAETLKTTTEEQSRLVEQTKERMAQEKTAMIESAKSELADIVVQATSTILKAKIDPAKDKALIDEALKQAQQ